MGWKRFLSMAMRSDWKERRAQIGNQVKVQHLVRAKRKPFLVGLDFLVGRR